MRIGVLGSGGREHAMQWCLERSQHAEIVHCLPGNGGTRNNVPIDPCVPTEVAAACERLSLDLLVVGPETPLAAGVVDHMVGHDTRVFGPTQAAARLESSKIWAKSFLERYGIPTAPFVVLNGFADLESAFDRYSGAVIKADGLAAGKGVIVCRDAAELADAWIRLTTLRPIGEQYLAEARLDGWELSLLILTDGKAWCAFPPSQDHKPLLDGDRGPNTGGMGAFCPVPGCDAALMRTIETRIIEPTLAGLRGEGLPYTGFLYFGLMITAEGPQVLEYNVRLGDPEAEVILPALETDLCAMVGACLDGRLSEFDVHFSSDFFVDVVLASPGYPGSVECGVPIRGLNRAGDALVFHAGTRIQDGILVTAGGRVLNIVGSGPSLDRAIERAYAAVDRIGFDGVVFRRDIGARPTSRRIQERS